jgi:NADPH-dependent 2,4-dienoyl-CoA reductase/sulfur reductase-like enzyme/nitrite reductase/ring-hydroxylating ferredoxin subunit
MPDEQWTKVAEEAELEEGKPISVEVDGEKVLLVRVGGEVRACGGKCTHYGAPLEKGLLVRETVTCPWHSARFDVPTGRVDAPPALTSVGCYPVKVEGGAVYVGEVRKPKAPQIEGEDERTFVIVGGGAAGNAAAITLREEGFAGRILMITAEPHRPYDRPTLSKELMSGEASVKWLPLHSEKFYERRRIELLTESRVIALEPDAHKLTLEDGKEIEYDRALLATGGVPRTLDVPGADLDGCFLLRSRRDAEAIVAAVEEAGRAVILGAGFIGMEVAASLREREMEVHVCAPEDVPMERVFGERVGRWLQHLHEEHGVRFHLGTTADEIHGDGRVEEVRLSDGTVLPADVVVIGAGVRPAVEFLEGTGLLEDGAVPVDGTLRTRDEAVWAAGDIARVPDPRTGEAYRIEHWVVAERQGRHAARCMLGSEDAYDEAPFFWTLQFHNSVKYIGHAAGADEVAFRGSVEDGKFLAGYYQDGRLRAVAGTGPAKPALALGEMLRAGRNVSREDFEDESVGFVELLGS